MTTVTTKTKHIDDLHFDHQLWESESRFYHDELKIYQKRLEEVAGHAKKEDIRKQIEHFQNKFIIQKDQLDIINHELTVHEQWLGKIAKQNPAGVDQEVFADHATMRDRVESFRKIYKELKVEFKHFLAYMKSARA